MEIEKHIQNLKDYIRIDKDNITYDDSDFAQFCKEHCEDIQAVLDELNNRIPIKKVETIEQELEEKNLEIDFEWDSEDVKIAKYEDKAKLDLCKELLNKE